MAKATTTRRRYKSTRAYHPSDPKALEAFLIHGRLPGENEIIVNEDSALACSAVWSCVRLISETVAMLPCQVYRRDGQFKSTAQEHQLYDLLHSAPNEDMTSFTFWQVMVSHLLLWGNCFAEIIRNNAGGIESIYPLLPNKVEIKRHPQDKTLVYEYKTSNNGTAYLTAYDVLHVPGLGFDGVVGYSPIRLAANAVGLSLAAEQFARKYFENGAVPSYVCTHPEVLGPDGVKYLEGYLASRAATRMPLILEEGIKVEPLTFNPVDSQLLEQRKWQRNEIATFFRVPPSKIGGDAPSNTYGNREADNASFLQESIAPWCERIEQELNRKLLSGTDYFAEFNVDAYLRGGTKERYEAYQLADWMTPDEKRQLENLPPLPKPEPVLPEPAEDPQEKTDDDQARKLVSAFALPAVEALRRMATKETNACANASRDKIEAFAAKHGDTLRSALEPACVGLAVALGKEPSAVDAFLTEVCETRAARLLVDAVGNKLEERANRIEQDAEAILKSLYQQLRGQ